MVLIVLGAFALTQSAFTVDQTEKAIVIQLGKPVGDKALGPGLHFKLPAPIDDVVRSWEPGDGPHRAEEGVARVIAGASDES